MNADLAAHGREVASDGEPPLIPVLLAVFTNQRGDVLGAETGVIVGALPAVLRVEVTNGLLGRHRRANVCVLYSVYPDGVQAAVFGIDLLHGGSVTASVRVVRHGEGSVLILEVLE